MIEEVNEKDFSKNVSARNKKNHNGDKNITGRPQKQTIFWTISIIFSIFAFGCSNFMNPRMRNILFIPMKMFIVCVTWFEITLYTEHNSMNYFPDNSKINYFMCFVGIINCIELIRPRMWAYQKCTIDSYEQYYRNRNEFPFFSLNAFLLCIRFVWIIGSSYR